MEALSDIPTDVLVAEIVRRHGAENITRILLEGSTKEEAGRSAEREKKMRSFTID